MCGICGVFSPGGEPAATEALRGMLDRLRHRGTADYLWSAPGVALGTRRLPIIDLVHSPQPIFNEDRSLVLVGNGEIFNFRELREDLRARGHRFSTDGDLEPALHLFEEAGNDAWNRLRGQFALAVYDVPRNRLTLVRDHLGIKPLFYYARGGTFLFGSEIKAILAHPHFRQELNPQAIADYLSVQFVPKPQTVYRDLVSLPAASYLEVTADGAGSPQVFWRIRPTSDCRLGREEVARETRRRLEDAVRQQMVSDVPVGILLSGGLDSSAIAALTSGMVTQPLSTFSIVFKERTFDESPHSRRMAEHLGSRHHEVVLDEEIIRGSMSEVAAFFDEPFCEGSAFPIYHICRHARDHVTVLLAGEGADEIFCGYEPYLAQRMASFYRRLPRAVRRLAHALAHRLPVSDGKVSFDLKARRFTAGAEFGPAKAHLWWRAAMNDVEKRSLLHPDFAARVGRLDTAPLYEQALEAVPEGDLINRIMAADCGLHLVDDLLLRGDRMSMAHTMELRVPFLDVDLVEFAFTLPVRRKLHGFQTKVPLRDAVRGLVPDAIRLRTKKGLNMPYQKWFKRPGWRELLHDTLSRRSIEAQGVLRHDAVEVMLRDHEAGRANHAHALWVMLNLGLWMNDHR